MISSFSSFKSFEESAKVSGSLDHEFRARGYQCLVMVASFSMCLGAVGNFPRDSFNFDLAILSILTIIFSSRLLIEVPESDSKNSDIHLSCAIYYFVAFHFGGGPAVLLAAVDALIKWYQMKRQKRVKGYRAMLFNAAIVTAAIGAAALAIPLAAYGHQLSNFSGSAAADFNSRLIVQMTAVYLASMVFHTTLIAINDCLVNKSSFLITWKDCYYNCAPTYLIAVLIAGPTFAFFQTYSWRAVGAAVLLGAGFHYISQLYALFVRKSFADLRRREQKLHYAARHDRLTGLPNRVYFEDRLNELITAAEEDEAATEEWHTNPGVAVLLIKFERFRKFKAFMGHQAGDQILVKIGDQLRRVAQSENADLVARIGSDSFAVLSTEIDDSDRVVRFAKLLRSYLKEPFDPAQPMIFDSFQIGIAIGCDAPFQPADLLRNAEIAADRAQDNKTAIEVFKAEMTERAANFLATEVGLERALHNDELILQYQPIVALWSGQLVGFEALVRWQDPQRGLIMPEEFVWVAEETGLIAPITFQTLRRACEQLKAWQISGGERTAHLIMSVNLSICLLANSDLASQVSEILREFELEPQYLKFEIAASRAMENVDKAIEQLAKLRELGVQLALDDFGAGLSRLSQLERYPIDTIKIDRAFVERINEDLMNLGIVKVILRLTKEANFEMIAQGVETVDQLETLRGIGCPYAQGDLFSKPLSHSDINRLMSVNEHWLPVSVDRVEVSPARSSYLPDKAKRRSQPKKENQDQSNTDQD